MPEQLEDVTTMDRTDQKTDPRVSDALVVVAQLEALDLVRAQTARHQARAEAWRALSGLIESRWGGPIVLVFALSIGLTLLSLAGVEVNLGGLADAAARAWTGSPPSRSEPTAPNNLTPTE